MTVLPLPNTPRITLLGTTALLFEAPGELDLAPQQRIWALADVSKNWPQVREAVPGMNNLMLTFETPPRDLSGLKTRLMEAWEECQPLPLQGQIIELPVVYGGDGGPHMADVIAHTGLDIETIANLHCEPLYPVYALGTPWLLLPGRHGPASGDAEAQGAGARHRCRIGVHRRRADRYFCLGRPQRLEHDRAHGNGVF